MEGWMNGIGMVTAWILSSAIAEQILSKKFYVTKWCSKQDHQFFPKHLSVMKQLHRLKEGPWVCLRSIHTYLWSMFLDYERKPEVPEKTHKCTGKSWKLHTERSLPGFKSSRALTTVPPPLCLCTLHALFNSLSQSAVQCCISILTHIEVNIFHRLSPRHWSLFRAIYMSPWSTRSLN